MIILEDSKKTSHSIFHLALSLANRNPNMTVQTIAKILKVDTKVITWFFERHSMDFRK